MAFDFSLSCPGDKTVDSTVLFLTLKTLDLPYREHKFNRNSFVIGPFQNKDAALAAREILSDQGFRCSPVETL